MSNKVTKQDVKKMIERVLLEKTSSKIRGFNINQATIDGFTPDSSKRVAQAVAGTANPKKDLNAADFDFAVTGDAKGQVLKLTKNDENFRRLKVLTDVASNDRIDPIAKEKAIKTLSDLAKNYAQAFGMIQNVARVSGEEGGRAEQPWFQTVRAAFLSGKGAKRLPQKDQTATKASTIADLSLDTGQSDSAKYRSELIEVFANLRKMITSGPTQWSEGLKLISDFSKFVLDPSSDPNGIKAKINNSALNYMTLCLGLDYTYRFVKEIEGGGNPYQFEAFLGLIAGGYVGGKEAGIYSGQGEADFVYQYKDGSGKTIPAMGSAKFYKDTSAGQSAPSFEIGKPVIYVYALKVAEYGEDDTSTSGTGGLPSGTKLTSASEEIIAIANYVFGIQKVWSAGIEDEDYYNLSEGSKSYADEIPGVTTHQKLLEYVENNPAAVKGKTIFRFTDYTGDKLIGYYSTNITAKIALKPGIKKEYLAATIEIPKTTRGTLVTAHKNAAKAIDNKVKLAFEKFEQLMKELSTAKEYGVKYGTSGKFDDGKKAMQSLNKSRKNLKNLSKGLKDKKETDREIDPNLKENLESKKITANFLKKLIEESFKK